jgi:hypothetical protein
MSGVNDWRPLRRPMRVLPAGSTHLRRIALPLASATALSKSQLDICRMRRIRSRACARPVRRASAGAGWAACRGRFRLGKTTGCPGRGRFQAAFGAARRPKGAPRRAGSVWDGTPVIEVVIALRGRAANPARAFAAFRASVGDASVRLPFDRLEELAPDRDGIAGRERRHERLVEELFQVFARCLLRPRPCSVLPDLHCPTSGR